MKYNGKPSYTLKHPKKIDSLATLAVRPPTVAYHILVYSVEPYPLVSGLAKEHTALARPALSDRDWGYIQDFQAALGDEKMEYCTTCKERWFDMGPNVVTGICARCTRRDTSIPDDNGPLLFSADNDMDPGDIPTELPVLTQAEEMLIARVHVHIELYQIRGQQWKYRGHIIIFLQNVGQVWDQLPLLPKDLQIVIIKPADLGQDQTERQFKGLRRAAVRSWLIFLLGKHPGHRDVVIDEVALAQLPSDSDIADQIQTQEVAPSTGPNDYAEGADETDLDAHAGPVTVAVPNLLAEETNASRIRRELDASVPQPATNQEVHMRMPAFDQHHYQNSTRLRSY
ncbi:hypothetical protein BDZ85DRAFT_283331 [Elsinoe ampelina]|uniref:DUF6570 domain-containing protein n=1 Tax=Elsinoe ampelina TaxID=302913 RepID=A0A6A6G675_9PEZI|nr:hypothetical protein BDZ85DRAFT_283331 [Elsinoe ampelina]